MHNLVRVCWFCLSENIEPLETFFFFVLFYALFFIVDVLRPSQAIRAMLSAGS